ncbi:phosphatidylglycerophosphatase A [Deferribacter autotrophicus]|uniref:Phosphatidylglycerophosphatase A n=1 Tax=Deferribacter autotrophicus TaxID=500465 RepID=A0A5A8F5V5_9BACT|nr:phosphatidylglycerophosphatase A [Deferribacter autotrophicus]KAA0258895.1 phosphatidylglycerophosphatase A [Deferribacter autotrophicus]
MHKFLKWTATGLNVGFIEYMPGTFGTLVAIPLIFLTGVFSIFFKFLFFIILFILGIIASEYYQHYYEKEDPSEVVIDEIAAFYFIMIFFPATLLNLILSFFIFRIFDIWKPYPIKQIEKSVSGGVGIMIDDIVAAIYTLIVMLIFKVFI